ncbi:MAG: hypothetical protein M3Y57_23815 [Acidobacteriota bacterium]|nr:hypothetical protein [Acidobacteriota bacterium]
MVLFQISPEVLGNGVIAPYVSHHKSTLHCPSVFPFHEAPNAFCAIFWRQWVIHVNGLTLYEYSILISNNSGTVGPLHANHYVWLLVRVFSVKTREFSISHDVREIDFAKSWNPAVMQEIVGENIFQLPSDLFPEQWRGRTREAAKRAAWRMPR